ncbi:MAG: hypothetical protein O3B13_25170 [Planctomycetota bacterium]|nr:hypothetical protein [Planctomycetota bacterium]MDA1166400.1 hypothetical protein [Planctomycetota bacterium]
MSASSDTAVSKPSHVVLKSLLDLSPQLYVRGFQPVIELPLDNDRAPCQPLGLRNHRVEAAICIHAWESCKVVLNETQLRGIIRVLEGIALNAPLRPDHIDLALDQEPLLDAISLMMSKHGRIDMTGTQLLRELNEIAAANGLDQRTSRWPLDASQLSRMLNELDQCLLLLGFQFTRPRTKSARSLVIESLPDDDGTETPSPSSSLHSCPVSATERQDDAGDDDNDFWSQLNLTPNKEGESQC